MNTSAATGAATKLTGLLILPSGEIYFFATEKKKKKGPPPQKLDQKWHQVHVFGCVLLGVALVSFRGATPLQYYQPS